MHGPESIEQATFLFPQLLSDIEERFSQSVQDKENLFEREAVSTPTVAAGVRHQSRLLNYRDINSTATKQTPDRGLRQVCVLPPASSSVGSHKVQEAMDIPDQEWNSFDDFDEMDTQEGEAERTGIFRTPQESPPGTSGSLFSQQLCEGTCMHDAFNSLNAELETN